MIGSISLPPTKQILVFYDKKLNFLVKNAIIITSKSHFVFNFHDKNSFLLLNETKIKLN